MPLTPAEVHNVAFKKPPIGKRGYDEDEVDAFLDDVEHELARLIEENNDLREQVERARSGRPAETAAPAAAAAAATAGAGDPALQRENADLKSHVERLEQQVRQAEQSRQQAEQQAQQHRQSAEQARQQAEQARAQAAAQPAAAAPAEPAGTSTASLAGAAGVGAVGGAAAGGMAAEGEQALSVLMTAQRTANEHVNDAKREAERLLTDARQKADEVTRDSQGKAETLERDAKSKAEALEKDARQRHQDAMGGLEVKRAALQKHIEELKAFEREYRSRLKVFLEGQLRDLDGKGQSLDSEMSRPEASAGAGTGGSPAGGLGNLSNGSASDSARGAHEGPTS